VGNFLGQKDYKNLRKAGFTAFLMAIIFMASTGTTFIFSKDLLPYFYIADQEVIQIASTLLIIAALFQISDGVQVVGLGTLRGISDVKIPTLITFTAYWIVGLPLAYILGFKAQLGAQGVWLGLLAGLTFSAFFLFFRFNQKTKGMKILEKHL
jgi:MATE family multidrug resistance protein